MFDDAPEPDRDDIDTVTQAAAEVDTPFPVDPPAEPGDTITDSPAGAATEPMSPPDLDVIEADLADVEVALERLDNGEYWRDETTGEPLGEAVLEQHPTARRNA